MIEKPQLFLPPTPDNQVKFKELFDKQHSDLKQIEDDLQMKRFVSHIDKVVAGYEKSQKRKGQSEQQVKTKHELKEQLIEQHKSKLAATPMLNRFIQIPTAHYLASSTTEVTIELSESFHCQVFADLWRQNYTLTAGDTFGGDFLCYPGDPLHYHASHIVVCCQNGHLSFDDVLKYARSSVIVNKQCVFAYRNEAGLIKYQTLEWISGAKLNDDAEQGSSSRTMEAS